MTSPSEGPPEQRRAAVVGTGLIGGSLGLALRERGWHVSGVDSVPQRARRAAELGALDRVGEDPDASIAFVATPVSATAEVARRLLGRLGDQAVVSDVGGVKASVVAQVDHPRFVGGHPMAGSEQEGVEGASAQLFSGATWVLTPTEATDPDAYLRVRSVVSSLGAEVVALAPERHDELVAVVSHVPHLTAAALMSLADAGARQHAALLRLAAGGFRDMTRVAAGHPGIWPDICVDNAQAITEVLDRLVSSLAGLRRAVAEGDRDALLELLTRARRARRNLPSRVAAATDLAEVRVPVPDRPGVLAEVTTLASQLGVNIADMEIAHSAEGDMGVVVMVVEGDGSAFVRALAQRGYRPAVAPLE
ncbi:MAG TPA: prephenate dehydrogenase/arogenate dehydrogenase family protein [Acidimicrobiales bacterium]|jgi:prephenate dehydrogenase|nr:prephenate dehydrogenase/arogenate dehydrogenase family protein [Acidimicrobiales bacterium]